MAPITRRAVKTPTVSAKRPITKMTPFLRKTLGPKSKSTPIQKKQ